MKYIDADNLIAEIERRKNQTERRIDNIVPIRRKETMDEEQLAKIELRDKVDKAYLNGALITLSDVLSFITSLQQEQPEEDLEKDIDRYIRPKCNYFYQGGSGYVHEKDVKEIAQHFYNLGLNAKK